MGKKKSGAQRSGDPRKNPPRSEGSTRFHCPSCRLTFRQRGTLLIGGAKLQHVETGEEFPLDSRFIRVVTNCPQCGEEAPAMDRVDLNVDGQIYSGFDPSPEGVNYLISSVQELIDELEQLGPDPTLEDIEGVLGKDPRLEKLIEYLRAHHVAYAGMLLTIVLYVLQALTGGASTPPPSPPGITRDQMERLIDELREDAAAEQVDGGERDRGVDERENGRSTRQEEPRRSEPAKPEGERGTH